MKYTILRNGLWGVRALDVREFNGGRGAGLFEQMENAHIYASALNEETIRQAMESLNTRERNVTVRTGEAGMRALDEALQRQVEDLTETIELDREAALASVGISPERSRGERPSLMVYDEEGYIQQSTPQIEFLDPHPHVPVPSREFIAGSDSFETTRNVPMNEVQWARLQRGDITPLDYLDSVE